MGLRRHQPCLKSKNKPEQEFFFFVASYFFHLFVVKLFALYVYFEESTQYVDVLVRVHSLSDNEVIVELNFFFFTFYIL